MEADVSLRCLLSGLCYIIQKEKKNLDYLCLIYDLRKLGVCIFLHNYVHSGKWDSSRHTLIASVKWFRDQMNKDSWYA